MAHHPTLRRPVCLLFLLLLLVSLFLGPSACDWFDRRTETVIEGRTMGTSYTVRAIDVANGISEQALRGRIETRLTEINGAMSTWDTGSEISRFNATRSTDWITVSKDFLTVINAAQAISRRSQGRFDVTVAPLIELWGFGTAEPTGTSPTEAEIEAVLDRVGYEKLVIDADAPRVRKTHPALTLNLSAIAKGYGVDAVAAMLMSAGVSDFLVEIGGEVRVAGHNVDDEPWRIAIEKPDAVGRVPTRIVQMDSGAMATSGDYRNFFIKDGQRYSHLLDPAAGRPILHRLASVSVVMADTMWADGYATAFMVMGEQDAYALAEAEDIAAFFLIREEGEALRSRSTSAFDRLTGSPSTPDGNDA